MIRSLLNTVTWNHCQTFRKVKIFTQPWKDQRSSRLLFWMWPLWRKIQGSMYVLMASSQTIQVWLAKFKLKLAPWRQVPSLMLMISDLYSCTIGHGHIGPWFALYVTYAKRSKDRAVYCHVGSFNWLPCRHVGRCHWAWTLLPSCWCNSLLSAAKVLLSAWPILNSSRFIESVIILCSGKKQKLSNFLHNSLSWNT